MQPPEMLVVMARSPVPGQTKTRLIPALGPTGAADLHADLFRHTLSTVDAAQKLRPIHVSIHFAGGDRSGMQSLFGAERTFIPQLGDDLGSRITSALRYAFCSGAERVVVIGTDCPGLEPAHIAAAFERLNRSDVAIGPALDGGYYLIGMRNLHAGLFHNIDWGGENVLRKTLQNAAAVDLSVDQLTPLSDVDNPEDLIQCRKNSAAFQDVLPAVEPGLISVVIPALNEESTLAAAITPLLQVPGLEIIVADGGSSDRTCEISESLGATVVRCSPGRGKQMNAGAAMARGEVLMFPHADACLPAGFDHEVWSILRDTDTAGGAFRLRIAGGNPLLRLVEFGANLRSRWLQLPYGDQALFLRADTFFQLDGFRTWPLMEDFEFCQRLRTVGTIRLAASSVTVSARRWKQLGIVRTTLINQLCIAGFRLGVSPKKLRSFYSRVR